MPPTLRAVLVNDTAAKGHHGCTLVNRQLAQLAGEAGIEISRTMPLTAAWDALTETGPDMLLVNGEGTLHHDTKGSRAIAGIGRAATRTGHPAFLINSICQALPPAVGEALKGFRGVWARDRQSQRSFTEFGIEAGYAPDLTLTYEAPSRSRTADLLFITDSSMSGETNALFRLSTETPGSRFLPLRSHPPRDRGITDRDTLRYRMKRAIARAHPDPVYRARYRNIVEDFEDLIALLQEQAGFLLAGRFHAVCIALDLGIPFFAIPTNSWKVEALLEEIGLSHRMLPSAEAFAQRAASLPPSRIAPFSQEEHAAIGRFKTMARRENGLMFQTIAASVRRPR
ncbi:Polysaccharide pyruvyl transferase [Methyloligella halotolerans]|uniref:Polysaccharide pyruvyl transferase n=1 Tax=Methyloligella halotolerans TaxID=1177755 RepID=A0A1E2S1X2_9HYPH|nr:polysaccharide pyruvyl transferase family protein [Methyloligella halotolerans]ODA68390.1 Polysaccharide pyruvyl transferase [Methyloligella halotolerans]